jgi:monoamine oxidase
VIDVAVLGAGLAGLSAARDLAAGGADVLVLEARERVGGRVESCTLPDGRVVQAGGEVFGAGHTAYTELVEELGLRVEPSYVVVPGEMTWGLVEGVFVGDDPAWMTERERADADRIERAFARLAAEIDPADPWAHPDAARLDALSVSDWLRELRALPAVHRRHQLASLSLSCDSPERTSLLAELRKHASLGGEAYYDLERWEGLRVADGSAAVAQRLASGLDGRIRLGAEVSAIAVTPRRTTITLAGGEQIDAGAVVCTIPAGPLREIAIDGVSNERVASLRAQRHALAAKVVVAYENSFWERGGQNGLAETEWLFGSSWPQGRGVLSLLVPPERLAAYLAAPDAARRASLLGGLTALYGEAAADPDFVLERTWGIDRFTRGYITSWAPGDVHRVGPLHATHEPPFYVAGSDQWVAGYMEGAVRTGRAAAGELLGRTSLSPSPSS